MIDFQNINPKTVLWIELKLRQPKKYARGKTYFGIFVDKRVRRNSIPAEYNMYQIRHSDEDWGEPVELSKNIIVNFYGTFFTKEELPLGSDPYAYLEIQEWYYTENKNGIQI